MANNHLVCESLNRGSRVLEERLAVRPARHLPKYREGTLEHLEPAVWMCRHGKSLRDIGVVLGSRAKNPREFARLLLGKAIDSGMMARQEYEALRDRKRVDSDRKRWEYFCDVANNIWHFNRGMYEELKQKHWYLSRNQTGSASDAEQYCLGALVRNGSITRNEADAIQCILYKFKQRRDTLAQLKSNATYFIRNKKISLNDLAIERKLCRSRKNPASHAVRDMALARMLNIIPPEEYRLKTLSAVYKLWMDNRTNLRGWKHPEYLLKFVLLAHEKTGLSYARIADFAEVPVQAVYDYKRRQDKLH